MSKKQSSILAFTSKSSPEVVILSSGNEDEENEDVFEGCLPSTSAAYQAPAKRRLSNVEPRALSSTPISSTTPISLPISSQIIQAHTPFSSIVGVETPSSSCQAKRRRRVSPLTGTRNIKNASKQVPVSIEVQSSSDSDSDASNTTPKSQKMYEMGAYGASYVICDTNYSGRKSVVYAGQCSKESLPQRQNDHKFGNKFSTLNFRMLWLEQYTENGQFESLVDEACIHDRMRKRLNPQFMSFCRIAGTHRFSHLHPEIWSQIKKEAKTEAVYERVKARLIYVLDHQDEFLISVDTNDKVR